MILQKNIEISINSRNYKYYTNIIENIENGKKYLISVDNLFIGSHSKILVSCDICNKELIKPYRQYLQSYKNANLYCCSPKCAQFKNKITNINKYGVENVFMSSDIKYKIVKTNNERHKVDYPSQSLDIRNKIISTNIKNYGVDNPAKSDIIKNKISNTCLLKYGTSNFNSSEYAKKLRIKNKIQVPDELKTEFEIYTKNVRNKTNRIKNKLLESWNGVDFYDNEIIINNFSLSTTDKNYPTIDHKISIYYGFINNIPYDVIGDIDNLCITKRGINSSKWTSCII